MKLRAIGDRVIIKMELPEEIKKTYINTSLAMPPEVEEKLERMLLTTHVGEVILIGPLAFMDGNDFAKGAWYKVGERVNLTAGVGHNDKDIKNGIVYRTVWYRDVANVIEED